MATRRRASGAWYLKKSKPHEVVVATVDRLVAEKRRDELCLWRDLFREGRPATASAGRNWMPRPEMRARMNVVRNACETLHARVSKNQPRPWIVTVGGNWKLQRKAKKLGRFVDGDWERLNADRLRRDAVMDCIKYGKGLIKVWPDPITGYVCWTPVWTGDVFTHKREEAAKHVRTKYQIAFVDREVAKAMWPQFKVEISDASAPDAKLLVGQTAEVDDDLIVVYEAWRLPSGKTRKGEPAGGRHVICIDTATLEDEDWPYDYFPFAELVAPGDNETNQGIGYPERMAGGQAEQNSLAMLASEVANKMTPKYCLENSSQYQADQATNQPAEFWSFTGAMPQILSAETNVLAIMQAAAIQRASLYAIEGISEQSAEGTSPDNLDSGKAKLVHRDIEAERHVELGKRVEEFTVELCKLHVACLEYLAEEGADLVAYSGKSMLEELRYQDVRLADDPHHVRVYPVSALSNTPQGKLSQLNEMLSTGVISIAEWRELYDMPDMDRSNDLAFAGRELSRKLVEQALEGEDDIAATRACDLPYLIDQAWKEHALAQLQGATTQELEKLRNLAGHAQSLLDQQMAAAAPPAPTGGMPPPVLPPPGAQLPVPMPQAAAPLPVPPMGPLGLVQ